MKTAQHALVFWTPDELKWLQDSRLNSLAYQRRTQLREEWNELLQPLVLQFPEQLPNTLTEGQFARASAVVDSQLALVGGEWMLLPIPVRKAPKGTLAAAVEFLGAAVEHEGEKVVQFHLQEELAAGAELVLETGPEGRYNDGLLMTSGYVWDDLDAASLQLRLERKDAKLSSPKKRKKLLAPLGLKETLHFPVTDGALANILAGEMPPVLSLWSHVMHATTDELKPLEKVDLKSLGVVFAEETQKAATLFIMDAIHRQVHAQHNNEEDGSLEEDEALLGGTSRRGGKKKLYEKSKRSLTPREELAVTHRRLTRQLMRKHAGAMEAKHQQEDEGRRTELAAKDTSTYSSKEVKKVESAEQSKQGKKAAARAERLARRAEQEEGKDEL